MKLRYIVYPIFFSLLFNCKENNLPNKGSLTSKKITEEDDSKMNKVVITGKTDDLNAFKYLNIMNNTYLFGKTHSDFTKEINADSLHMVLNSIDKPLFSEIAAFSDSSFYRGYIFLIPGDTVHIEIKNGRMKFLGKNEIFNNYWTQMNKKTPKYTENPYLGSLKGYKKSVKTIYDKKVNFLDFYINENSITSKLFVKTLKKELEHEFLYNLIHPRNINGMKKGTFLSNNGGPFELAEKELVKNSEAIIDLQNYFGTINIEEFKDIDALRNSFYFKYNINEYIRCYFLNAKYLAFSKEKFIAEKEFIQENFEGEIEHYAIAKMLKDYHSKGFGNSVNSIDIIRNLIKEYETKFSKPSYLEELEEIKEDLNNYNFELSFNALNSMFINVQGDTLNLKKVFGRSNKRIKVLDFWASWCSPCIKQIAEGKAFKDRLSIKNNVDWIYISPEKDYKKWLKANEKYDQTLNFYNSFYLLKGRKAALSRFFEINHIPRYIIFDKKNTIILNNAPSPSDEKAFERVIDSIYKKDM